MKAKKSPDFQTMSFFIILALLTWGLIALMKVVLFVPTATTLIDSATR